MPKSRPQTPILRDHCCVPLFIIFILLAGYASVLYSPENIYPPVIQTGSYSSSCTHFSQPRLPRPWACTPPTNIPRFS